MSSFLVKIVGDFCNLRCTYCTNREFDQGTKKVMSTVTLGYLIKLLATLPQSKVRVSWHGGEPLLAGKNFFKNIIGFELENPNKTWDNSIQTNATQVDEEWAKLLQHHHFGVGVSVDGNEETHNSNRINLNRQGSYNATMSGVKVLRSCGLNPGAICTVTKETALRGEEMLLGLTGAGFKNVSFNSFYNTASMSGVDEFGLSESEWLKFQIDIFETWLSLNDPTIHIREVDAMLAWVKSRVRTSCSYRGGCSQWLSIDTTGFVYPCERLGKGICFGNIHAVRTFSEITQGDKFINWQKSIERLPRKCQLCKLQPMCHNGCTSHRQMDNEGVPLYIYCESRRGFYDYIRRRTNGEKGV